MAKRSQISRELERSNAQYMDDLVANTVTLEDDSTISGTITLNGINLTPNNIATSLLGLNPTWIQNFGGATLAAGDHTTDVQMY